MSNKSGYTYILINPAMKNVLKIGRTSSDSEKRKNELDKALKAGTGISSDFIVAYDEYVEDCVLIENLIHKKLDKFRVNQNKEFFNLPLKDAIKTLIQIISEEQNNQNIDFAIPKKPEYKRKWNSLNFNLRQLIKLHIKLNNNLSDSEIIDCLRNIIDFSQDKNDRKIVLELYKHINYRDNLHKWFIDLPSHQKQIIKSYTNRQLTDREFDEILNLKNFDCRDKYFVTEIKSLTILKNIEILNLSHTKIDDLSAIELFDNLKELHFNQTNIKSLKPLLKMTNLKRIYCIGSKIDKKDIDYFYEFRNDCEIINKSFMDNDK